MRAEDQTTSRASFFSGRTEPAYSVMRIYLSSSHKYPGWRYGMSSSTVHDSLAKGLGELGHEVRYHLRDRGDARLPKGVTPVYAVRGDEDVLHLNHLALVDEREPGVPWVRTLH